jgi:hypothetical protein
MKVSVALIMTALGTPFVLESLAFAWLPASLSLSRVLSSLSETADGELLDGMRSDTSLKPAVSDGQLPKPGPNSDQ